MIMPFGLVWLFQLDRSVSGPGEAKMATRPPD